MIIILLFMNHNFTNLGYKTYKKNQILNLFLSYCVTAVVCVFLIAGTIRISRLEQAKKMLSKHLRKIYNDGNPEYVEKVFAEIDK